MKLKQHHCRKDFRLNWSPEHFASPTFILSVTYGKLACQVMGFSHVINISTESCGSLISRFVCGPHSWTGRQRVQVYVPNGNQSNLNLITHMSPCVGKNACLIQRLFLSQALGMTNNKLYQWRMMKDSCISQDQANQTAGHDSTLCTARLESFCFTLSPGEVLGSLIFILISELSTPTLWPNMT